MLKAWKRKRQDRKELQEYRRQWNKTAGEPGIYGRCSAVVLFKDRDSFCYMPANVLHKNGDRPGKPVCDAHAPFREIVLMIEKPGAYELFDASPCWV